MAHKFKLSKDVLGEFEDMKTKFYDLRAETQGFAEDIRTAHEEHQGAWNERSETWQEGERGEATSSWLERVEALADLMEETVEALESAGDELLDFPEEPEY